MTRKSVRSPTPKKVERRSSARKVMLNAFRDMKGILLIDILVKGQTLIEDYYSNLLQVLIGKIKRKQKGILFKGVLLLHDKAPPHTTKTTLKTIDECGL